VFFDVEWLLGKTNKLWNAAIKIVANKNQGLIADSRERPATIRTLALAGVF
jgi:hypothetical protein